MDFSVFNSKMERTEGSLHFPLKALKHGKTLAVTAGKIDYERNRLAVLNSMKRAEGDKEHKLITSFSADGMAVLVHRLSGETPERKIRIMLRATEVGNVFDDGTR